jgi:xanthine dehydrogenase small subunit
VSGGFLPAWFSGIEAKLSELRKGLNTPEGGSLVLGGGTDLIVQKPHLVKEAAVRLVYDDPSLKTIGYVEGRLRFGASVTVTQFLESEIVRRFFPHLPEHIKLVSSTPIRNMATLAGNLVNASPIGDMTIFLLALDADISLVHGEERRTVLLRDFYKGYKQLDKLPAETVETISFIPPAPGTHFNFEKVAKRSWLDIASVNSACWLHLADDGTINNMHLSAGGVGPTPKYLANTVAFLTGKKWTSETFEEALHVANEEIAPISDARGTAAYKRLLLRQLLAAHLQRFGIANDILQKMLPV